jgi:hypothetical protein
MFAQPTFGKLHVATKISNKSQKALSDMHSILNPFSLRLSLAK